MSRFFNRNKKLTFNRVSTVTVILITIYTVFFTSTSFAEQVSSIDLAVQEIRTETKGKIISADTIKIENVSKHRIKVLMPNGHVKVFYKSIRR